MIKCKWPFAFVSISDFFVHPELCSTKIAIKSRPPPGSWVAPLPGELKFNVDASTRESFGEAGIGGVLRDNRGSILVKFSKFIGLSEPTGAELEAILEACRIVSNENWLKSYRLVIESDSIMVLSWIVDSKPCPVFLEEKVFLCKQFRARFKWEFTFAFREANCDAHELATFGVQTRAQLLWIAKNNTYQNSVSAKGLFERD
ncbi:hypothetical protein GQ457_07G031190 [Hibiscus cannabinus]